MNKNTKALILSNLELSKGLSTRNDTIMTDIVCYLRGANITIRNQEEIRRDILEMVLDAQDRGEQIESVIGEDYQTFCDEVIESVPAKTRKERIMEIADTIILGVGVLTVINLLISSDMIEIIKNLKNGKPVDFLIHIPVSTLVMYVIIISAAILIVKVICKAALKQEKTGGKSKWKRFATGGVIGGVIAALFITLAWLGRTTLFAVNLFVGLGFAVLCFVVHRYLSSDM